MYLLCDVSQWWGHSGLVLHTNTNPEFWSCHHQSLKPETATCPPSWSDTLRGPWGPWPHPSPWSSPSVCGSPRCHPNQTASAHLKHRTACITGLLWKHKKEIIQNKNMSDCSTEKTDNLQTHRPQLQSISACHRSLHKPRWLLNRTRDNQRHTESEGGCLQGERRKYLFPLFCNRFYVFQLFITLCLNEQKHIKQPLIYSSSFLSLYYLLNWIISKSAAGSANVVNTWRISVPVEMVNISQYKCLVAATLKKQQLYFMEPALIVSMIELFNIYL